MPDKNRLLKRQNEYLRASGIYLNPEEDDLFDKEKNAAASEIRKLNRKLADLTPYNSDGTLKSEDKLSSKLSTEDCDNLMELYQQSIKAMHKLVTAINDHIDTLDKDASEGRDPYFAGDYTRERRSCEEMVELFDKIAKTMSKDLRALQHVKKKNLSVSLDTVFENSRVNSEYEVLGEIKQSDKGNQNERIPMTIVGKDGQPIKGYFTRDSRPKYGRSYFNSAVREARKKYGKDARFLSTSLVRSLYYKFVDRNKRALDLLVGDGYAISMMGYDEAVGYLSKNMGSSIKSYINTPQKLNMFIDVVGKGFSAINQENILEAVGINEKAHVNRRNAAMSKIAELLGCPEILAESQNIRIKINGKYFKGTFMKEAIGEDINKIDKNSLMLDSSLLSGLDLSLKKQIAALQIVDFLSGNPDRHSGNMLYFFQKDDHGKVHLKRIQGIDNDSSLGSEEFDEVGMSEVLLNSMKVIPEELANKVMNLDPEALKQMLYGFDLTTKEINNALGRLTKLQNKLKNDAKEYLKGYTEGYLIPGSIKSVSDEEFSAIPLDILSSRSAGEKRNQFERISNVLHSGNSIEKYYENAKKNYEKAVYNYTIGSADKMNSLIDELNRDNRLGGSSTEYNNMLAAMKNLSKSLIGFNGPVCGKNADTKNGHVKALTEIREKIRETLISVNEYIYYKQSKQKGEEWRDIKEPHEPSRTERRYHDAERCCEFLTKQLEKYDELTEKLSAFNEINQTYKTKRDAADRNDVLTMNDPEYIKNYKEYNNKLYTNHLSRSKYLIKEAFDKLSASPDRYKPYHTMNFDMSLGYGLFSVKPEDKESFKKDIEALTGAKITLSEDELLKRAIASDLIITKASCEDKIAKAKNNPKLRVSKNVKKLFEDLKHIETRPYDQAVNNLINNDTFDAFFQSYKEDFHLNDIYHHPGIPTPDPKETAKMIEAYNEALYKKHPELEPAKPDAGKNKSTQKKVTKAL